jgi:hypothetical protein
LGRCAGRGIPPHSPFSKSHNKFPVASHVSQRKLSNISRQIDQQRQSIEFNKLIFMAPVACALRGNLRKTIGP